MVCILECVMWTFLFLVTLLVLYLYQPLPYDLDDRFRKRIFLVIFRLFYVVGFIAEKLGFGPRRLVFKHLLKSKFVSTPTTENDVQFYDISVGKDSIRVRVYDFLLHKAQDSRPALLFLHGGGWSLGSIEMYHSFTLEMAKQTDAIVFSVDYRLAPENPYPIPLQDCETALKYVFENAEKFNVYTTRVAVMGDSAGGNLAAAVCLKLRDSAYEYRPKLQVLIYPAVQIIDLQLPSYRNPYQLLSDPLFLAEFVTFYTGLKNVDFKQMTCNDHVSQERKRKHAGLIELLPAEFRKGYSMYLTKGDPELCEKFDKFVTDPYFAPLMAVSLKDLPEAYIWTAGYDVLRDEGIMYTNKLKQDGVQVTWINKAEAMHGDFNFDFPASKKYRQEVYEFIKNKL